MILHVINITSDQLNIHETFASHLNIQTSKKEQLHMKKDKTKWKSTTSNLINQQGKKKNIRKNEKRWHDKKQNAKQKHKTEKYSLKVLPKLKQKEKRE